MYLVWSRSADMPKMVIVTPYYDGVGGVAVAVRQLASEFVARGYSVDILTRGRTSSVVADESEPGVFRIRLRVPLGTFKSFTSFLAFLPWTLFGLYRFLRRAGAQTVLIQYANPGHFYFGILRPWSKWSLFVTFQGDDAHRIGSGHWSYRGLYAVLLRKADGIIAVSTSLLSKVVTAVPNATERRTVIPNGSPTIALSGVSEADHALAVGLLQHRKGFDLLIRALGALRRRGRPQNVMVVGDGPERESLEALARAEGVQDDVRFIGTKSHDAVIGLMQSSRYFVLSSRAEGLPLVLVEAMMCGRAVVATAVDGVPEIVKDGLTGILIEPEDEAALADAMDRMDRDDALRQKFGGAGRIVAEELSWKGIASRYLEAFRL